MSSSPARYWRELGARYRLEASKCTICGAVYYPPVTPCLGMCQACRRKSIGKMKTIRLPRRGKIVSYTIVRDMAPPDFKTPYAIALIDLGEKTILGRLTDCNLDELHIGMEVEAVGPRRLGEQGKDKSGIIKYSMMFRPISTEKEVEVKLKKLKD